MNSPSTDTTFSYSIAQVGKMLNVDSTKIQALCNALDIHPHRDERTGQPVFKTKDLELMRKALNAEKKSDASPTAPAANASQLPQTASQTLPSRSGYSSAPQRTSDLSRTDLSIIVDSVSNVKEGILRDLSELLDDKLAGLDEIVIELIRSKNENDSLREELKRLEENRDHLQSELSKFKPAAFGFYRKE